MNQTPYLPNRERITAGLLTLAGMSVLTYSLKQTEFASIHTKEYLLAVLFAGVIILADQYPIHLLRGTKLILINLPIFLSTTLLPPSIAVLATGAGLLISNLLVRTERGLLPGDIFSIVGQWMFTVFLGSQIVRLHVPGLHEHTSTFILLILCASAYLLADFIIFSISQFFIYGEPFVITMKSVFREGFSLEIIQYLTAILGTLAAHENLWSLLLLTAPISVTYFTFKNLKETRYETLQILEAMADTVDLRDVYTGGHSKRVANLVHQVLHQLTITGPEATLIETAARLHDIGKIGIPDSILQKPDKLLPEEMAIMQTHPQKGAELISKYKDFPRGAMVILHHHERWDGRGYPAGLKAHEIPFGARVIAVADSFDAMTSDRPYRNALSVDQAVQILLEGRGKQWDAIVVNAFVDVVMNRLDEKPSAPKLFHSQQILPAFQISSQ